MKENQGSRVYGWYVQAEVFERVGLMLVYAPISGSEGILWGTMSVN